MGSVEERLLLPPPPARSGDAGAGGAKRGKWEKTYLDVLGVCCSAEVALVERLLKPIDGVRAVTVVVPSRTVIVEHDLAAVSQSHIGNLEELIHRRSTTGTNLLDTAGRSTRRRRRVFCKTPPQ
uniref:Heavy metal ATPase 3 isoform 9 n=1 Tax=Zea mays TaxID=4577 RepID=A0A8E5MYF1_MAIZE|nr:heavy metal ATPase 3 isoform 9 [Zea mays]